VETISPRPFRGDDPEFQKRQWFYQRCGWILLLLLLAAAATGFLGPGLYSSRGRSGDGFAMKYDRVLRCQTPGSFAVDLAAAFPDEIIEVQLTEAYLDKIAVENVVPEPEQSGISSGFIYWKFERARQVGAERLYFDIRPRRPGVVNATISVQGRPLTFRQLILP
jgi:hypothetical protein